MKTLFFSLHVFNIATLILSLIPGLDTAVGDCTDITVFKNVTTCNNSTFIITVAPARKICQMYTSDKAEDVSVTIRGR